MIDRFINYKVLLVTLSLTIFYLYIISDNNIILKKNVSRQ
jgi:hypothetical protein